MSGTEPEPVGLLQVESVYEWPSANRVICHARTVARGQPALGQPLPFRPRGIPSPPVGTLSGGMVAGRAAPVSGSRTTRSKPVA